MISVAAAPTPGKFFVVCDVCLWTPGYALLEQEAFNAASGHKDKCPGEIPASTTKSQITRARKILSGDY